MDDIREAYIHRHDTPVVMLLMLATVMIIRLPFYELAAERFNSPELT
jgi:hypothetical protein